MIIVSQDKYNILNFDTTVNVGVEEITTLRDIVQISAQTNGNTVILGEYATEERAKEVLQEIKNTYKHGIIRVQIENCKWVEENQIYEMPDE